MIEDSFRVEYEWVVMMIRDIPKTKDDRGNPTKRVMMKKLSHIMFSGVTCPVEDLASEIEKRRWSEMDGRQFNVQVVCANAPYEYIYKPKEIA